jgi:hypothetical protein
MAPCLGMPPSAAMPPVQPPLLKGGPSLPAGSCVGVQSRELNARSLGHKSDVAQAASSHHASAGRVLPLVSRAGALHLWLAFLCMFSSTCRHAVRTAQELTFPAKSGDNRQQRLQLLSKRPPGRPTLGRPPPGHNGAPPPGWQRCRCARLAGPAQHPWRPRASACRPRTGPACRTPHHVMTPTIHAPPCHDPNNSRSTMS